MTATMSSTATGDAPGAASVVDMLQQQLDLLNDLALTLKHAHWNVSGPHFIAVHTMLDPQVDAVRDMIDEIAERIAAMGASPDGRLGGITARRSWDEYRLANADALDHLAELQTVYARVIDAHRQVAAAAESDAVVHDLLTAQSAQLEKFGWFVRAHAGSAQQRA